jgi:hypothetical protein
MGAASGIVVFFNLTYWNEQERRVNDLTLLEALSPKKTLFGSNV